ncbi:hypothetical protein B0H14DRAFT_2650959 [Mycena olivaceomarginata]|nr:hypothetical protein B0H14DRAFT_2650959 [Mycena olivaceomarginata]
MPFILRSKQLPVLVSTHAGLLKSFFGIFWITIELDFGTTHVWTKSRVIWQCNSYLNIHSAWDAGPSTSPRQLVTQQKGMHTITQKGVSLPPCCIPGIPPVPAAIREDHGLLLPPQSQDLYEQSRCGDIILNERCLRRWRHEPPFPLDPDDAHEANPWSPGAADLTERIVILLHAVRLQEREDDDALRWVDFHLRGWEACISELREEVRGLLARWETSMDSPECYDPNEHLREYTMERQYFE